MLKHIQTSEVVLGESAEVLKEYASLHIDLVVTSPPYFNQRTEYAEYTSREEYLKQMQDIFIEVYRVMKEGAIIVLNIGQDRTFDLPSEFSLLLEDVGFQYIDTICWNKDSEIGERGKHLANNLYYPNFSWEPIFVYCRPIRSLIAKWEPPRFEERFAPYISSSLRTNVWNITPSREKDHPAAFPIKLPYNAIICYSEPGNIILDPFGGSGTTAMACEEVGNRKYLLIERKKEYYDLITSRLSQVQHTLGL